MTEQHPRFEPTEADLTPPDGIAASLAQREAMRRVLIEMVRDGIAVPIGTDANGRTIFRRTGKAQWHGARRRTRRRRPDDR